MVLKRNVYNARNNSKIQVMELLEVDEKSAINLAKQGIIHDTTLYASVVEENFSKKLKIVEGLSAETWVLTLNNQKDVLKELPMRACLAKSFYESDFVERFLPTHLKAKGYLPPTLPGYSEMIDSEYEVAPSFCNKYHGTTIELNYPSELKNGDEMCSYLKMSVFYKYNIKCNSLDFNDLISSIVMKTFDMSLLSMTLDLPDISYYVSVFGSNKSFNLSNLNNDNLDKMIDRALFEKDRATRAILYKKINKTLFQINATINVSYPKHASYIHTCVEGVEFNLAGDQYINYSKVYLRPDCDNLSDFGYGS